MTAANLPLGCLAPAKINLGLFVGALREDGRHELVSVMQSISLADRLTLSWAEPDAGADQVDCPQIDGENLAARALAGLRAEIAWQAPALRLTIDKCIPVAAGLGGGSADAAGALRLAAATAGSVDGERLLAVGRTLGSDVPAQVTPGRWLASGAGETLQALAAPIVPFGVLVLPLARPLSTAAVYRRADELSSLRSPEQLERHRVALSTVLAGGAQLPPVELLCNDLQEAAISLCPGISQRLDLARAQDPDHVLLSGSGPTVLGLFAGPQGPERARAAAGALAAHEPSVVAAVPVGPAFAAVREQADATVAAPAPADAAINIRGAVRNNHLG